jgi:hypothetical protein
MIVLHLLGLDAALADGDATLQAGIAAAAVAGEEFDAIRAATMRPCTRPSAKALLRFRVRLTSTSMAASGGRENPHRL